MLRVAILPQRHEANKLLNGLLRLAQVLVQLSHAQATRREVSHILAH